MKRILYAGGSFLTGDRIAEAVLEYAAELANAGKAAKLDVPVLDLEQRPEQVSLVIGPSSQLLAEPITVGQEIDDEAFTQRVRRMTHVLQTKSGTADGGDSAAFAAT
ncbi:MAG TPA: hypothetical protein VGM38_10495 [Pseudolysinimonas sp.]